MSAITHLFARFPVADLEASIDWYTRFFGRPTYSNGVRHVNVRDPHGIAIAFAEPPDAASASPRAVAG